MTTVRVLGGSHDFYEPKSWLPKVNAAVECQALNALLKLGVQRGVDLILRKGDVERTQKAGGKLRKRLRELLIVFLSLCIQWEMTKEHEATKQAARRK